MSSGGSFTALTEKRFILTAGKAHDCKYMELKWHSCLFLYTLVRGEMVLCGNGGVEIRPCPKTKKLQGNIYGTERCINSDNFDIERIWKFGANHCPKDLQKILCMVFPFKRIQQSVQYLAQSIFKIVISCFLQLILV